MKRAVILHGTDGNPSHHWQPWLREQLIERGYEVWIPELPGSHTPDKEVYGAYLREQGWDFKDNLIIGHSSGATEVLNLLSSEWFPRVSVVVLVGVFLDEGLLSARNPDRYDDRKFEKLFPEKEFEPGLLNQKTDNFYFIHGDDDPYCDITLAREFCRSLKGTFITVTGGGHLSSGRIDLPEISPILDVL